MKEFVKKNFNVIILVIAVLGLFKSCGDTRQLSKISKQMETCEYCRETYSYSDGIFCDETTP